VQIQEDGLSSAEEMLRNELLQKYTDDDFEFEDWGFYNIIGFQAKPYFAGYINDENVMMPTRFCSRSPQTRTLCLTSSSKLF